MCGGWWQSKNRTFDRSFKSQTFLINYSSAKRLVLHLEWYLKTFLLSVKLVAPPTLPQSIPWQQSFCMWFAALLMHDNLPCPTAEEKIPKLDNFFLDINGIPRRNVNFQALNVHAIRKTYHTHSPFHQARSVPQCKTKAVFDHWNGYHSVPIRSVDTHLKRASFKLVVC